jgi:DNA-binding NarL/FixJ family response regulator
VLCVEDKREVADAIRLIINSDPALECVGCLESADDLMEKVENGDLRPDVVILDATMPGEDPMTAMATLAVASPSIRTILYSAQEDRAIIRRARESGAWAYVSKDDEPRVLLRAVREVAAGRAVWIRR